MPQTTLSGAEVFADHLVTKAAMLVIMDQIDKLHAPMGTEAEPIDWRTLIENEALTFNHPDVQQAIPNAVEDLMRLLALVKDPPAKALK